MMQSVLDVALDTARGDLLTVYDLISPLPVKRRPTVCEARYHLRQLVNQGRLRCVGDERDGYGYRIRQYRRV